MSELKPCPFCGKTKSLHFDRYQSNGEWWGYIECTECLCTGPVGKLKKDAEEAFINMAKGRPLIPKNFTSIHNIEKVRGIYIPFWFHTFKVSGELNYSGEKITHWSIGNTYYTKTDYYDIVRGGTLYFKSVPIDSVSSSFLISSTLFLAAKPKRAYKNFSSS